MPTPKFPANPCRAVIKDEAWLQGEFITTVQQRGAAIIKARGLSSAASAANAAVNTVYKLTHPTPAGDWVQRRRSFRRQLRHREGTDFQLPNPQQRREF
ncbi:MAG: hypothetical protein WDM76_00290 [Limisphaerales bacterium]